MTLRSLLLSGCALLCLSAAPAQPAAEEGRFVALDVVVDPHGKPLAAWQVEVSGPAGDFTVVGLEGGDGAFDAPPYYDPKAADGRHERVVVAQFSLEKAGKLPIQAARVATVHALVKAGAQVRVKLVVATDENGNHIGADCALKEDGK